MIIVPLDTRFVGVYSGYPRSCAFGFEFLRTADRALIGLGKRRTFAKVAVDLRACPALHPGVTDP